MNPLYNPGLLALQIGNDDRSRGIAIQLVCSQINLIMLILGTGNQLAFLHGMIKVNQNGYVPNSQFDWRVNQLHGNLAWDGLIFI